MRIYYSLHVWLLLIAIVVSYQVYSTQYKLIAVSLSVLVASSHANYHQHRKHFS
jgi:hypothetical protein